MEEEALQDLEICFKCCFFSRSEAFPPSEFFRLFGSQISLIGLTQVLDDDNDRPIQRLPSQHDEPCLAQSSVQQFQGERSEECGA